MRVAGVRHERLTVEVKCREDNAVERSDRWEKQRSRQTSAPEPFRFSSKDTGGYEDIISIKRRQIEGLAGANIRLPEKR